MAGARLNLTILDTFNDSTNYELALEIGISGELFSSQQ